MKKSYLIVVSIVVIVVVIAAITIHTNSNTRMSMSTSTQVSKDAVSTNQVNITNYAFSAAVIKVSTGTTVTWTNMDNVHHTVTVDSGTSSGPNSGELAIGQKYSYKFTKPGTYSYHCMIHPEMHGTVIVT